MNSNGCKLFSLGRRGKEVIMTNYPFSKLSSSCSVSVKLFLQHSSLQALLSLPLLVLFIPFGSNQHFCISQPFQGLWWWTVPFSIIPSESLIVMSLNICKDNAFHNHFNLNLSIIMIEGDSLSFTCEGMGHFSNLHIASKLSASSNTTLICNFAKKWLWASFL